MRISSIRFQVIIFLFLLISFHPAHGSECRELGPELEALRKAQKSIVMSLVKNHSALADQTDELADDLAMSENPPLPAVIKNMKKTSQAYRTRGEKGQEIAQRLDASSAELFAKIRKCLK